MNKKPITLLYLLLLALVSVSDAQPLKSNMKINILISGVPEREVSRVSSIYLIDEEGYIRLPLLEGVKVKASGISGPKLALRIADAYREKKIYSSPILTVTSFRDEDKEQAIIQERLRIVQENERLRLERLAETQVVHVEGDAKKPGKYKLTVGMTVRALLAECGGDSEWGSNERFLLKRRGKAEVEYNYKSQPSALSIRLKAGDFVKIPKGRGLLGKK